MSAADFEPNLLQPEVRPEGSFDAREGTRTRPLTVLLVALPVVHKLLGLKGSSKKRERES